MNLGFLLMHRRERAYLRHGFILLFGLQRDRLLYCIPSTSRNRLHLPSQAHRARKRLARRGVWTQKFRAGVTSPGEHHNQGRETHLISQRITSQDTSIRAQGQDEAWPSQNAHPLPCRSPCQHHQHSGCSVPESRLVVGPGAQQGSRSREKSMLDT